MERQRRLPLVARRHLVLALMHRRPSEVKPLVRLPSAEFKAPPPLLHLAVAKLLVHLLLVGALHPARLHSAETNLRFLHLLVVRLQHRLHLGVARGSNRLHLVVALGSNHLPLVALLLRRLHLVLKLRAHLLSELKCLLRLHLADRPHLHPLAETNSPTLLRSAATRQLHHPRSVEVVVETGGHHASSLQKEDVVTVRIASFLMKLSREA